MVMALDAANFFIRGSWGVEVRHSSNAAVADTVAASRRDFSKYKRPLPTKCLSGLDCDPFLVRQERATRIFVKGTKLCGRRGRRGYGGKSLSEPEQEPGGIRTNKERRCPRMRAAPFVALQISFPACWRSFLSKTRWGKGGEFEGRGTPSRVSRGGSPPLMKKETSGCRSRGCCSAFPASAGTRWPGRPG